MELNEDYQNLLDELKLLTQYKISLTDLQEELEVSEEQILGLISILKHNGTNIVMVKEEDDIYFLNQGERTYKQDYTYNFNTDETNKIKFLILSDLRLGSKFSQQSILNELYINAYNEGIRNVLIIGNITEGLYSMENNMIETLIAPSSISQIEYVTKHFPKLEGMKTYFITGKKDKTHLVKNKIDIGKQISSKRNDLIYIGNGRCNIKVDNVNILATSRNTTKPYTQSYRTQKMIDAMRSEDKPDLILYGGLLQSEKFVYRDVKVITIPSVCASTWEMEDKEYSNTVGAWLLELETDKKGKLKTYKTCDNIYYQTIDNDYEKAKILKRGIKNGLQ